uniref:Reverse transcriptase domain-containing protein n=1 Tax=Tanacetum cinerariifolium TaxID=118510 RepID=A0A6L2K240_TANCI|nr:hypothetical protein [Tanacetum cinerariifolium]
MMTVGNYHQLLPIIAKKVHQEKLKAAKACLNFEEVSQHSELGIPSRKRIGSRRVYIVSKNPELRLGRPESPIKKDPERKMVFKRLEKGVFHRLEDKGKRGILTLKSSKIIPVECAAVLGLEGQPLAINQAIEERIKKPADMTGVPRNITKHQLNVREGCPIVRQKKRAQAADRN